METTMLGLPELAFIFGFLVFQRNEFVETLSTWLTLFDDNMEVDHEQGEREIRLPTMSILSFYRVIFRAESIKMTAVSRRAGYFRSPVMILKLKKTFFSPLYM